MAEQSGMKVAEDRDQVAAYVAEMTCELALIARRHGFDALSFLLEMAQLEAEHAKRPANGRR
jgi:hypothetical protein